VGGRSRLVFAILLVLTAMTLAATTEYSTRLWLGGTTTPWMAEEMVTPTEYSGE